MKKTPALLLSLLFVSLEKINAQQISPMAKPEVTSTFDPYFAETRDTISTHGPHTITRNQLQDKNGNYWFATWQGIIKYDGKVFTNYTLKENLIHFHVFSVFEDKKGNIWFGTVRGGLYKYDPSASHSAGGKLFTLFTTKDGLADNSVSTIMEDKAGNIWFSTWAGASRYDGKTFTNFTTKDGLGDDKVNTIIQDKTGKLWFGTKNGIDIFDGKSFTSFTNAEGVPFKDVTSLMEDKNGNIWIGRMEGGGLCKYDPSAALSAGGKSFTNFMTNFIGYMLEDKKGNLWFTVTERNTTTSQYEKPRYNQVLYRYNGTAFTKVIEKYQPYDHQVFGIAEDKTGNIWFGTMRGSGRYDGKYSHYFWE